MKTVLKKMLQEIVLKKLISETVNFKFIEFHFKKFCSYIMNLQLIDDYNVKQINPAYLRRVVVSVGQEPTLFSFTIRENIGKEMIQVTTLVDASAYEHDFSHLQLKEITGFFQIYSIFLNGSLAEGVFSFARIPPHSLAYLGRCNSTYGTLQSLFDPQ